FKTAISDAVHLRHIFFSFIIESPFTFLQPLLDAVSIVCIMCIFQFTKYGLFRIFFTKKSGGFYFPLSFLATRDIAYGSRHDNICQSWLLHATLERFCRLE